MESHGSPVVGHILVGEGGRLDVQSEGVDGDGVVDVARDPVVGAVDIARVTFLVNLQGDAIAIGQVSRKASLIEDVDCDLGAIEQAVSTVVGRFGSDTNELQIFVV